MIPSAYQFMTGAQEVRQVARSDQLPRHVSFSDLWDDRLYIRREPLGEVRRVNLREPAIWFCIN
jgi:hypothetical protein